MRKKKASGMISPPAGCEEELQIPRSRDDGGSGYRRFHGILIGGVGFLHRGLLIGEEARQGATRATAPPGVGWAHPHGQGVWPTCRLLHLVLRLRVPHGKIM